jgi:hypothetical protein
MSESAERLLESMREQAQAYYRSVGYYPPTVALKPGRRPVRDLLAAAVGASPKGLAHMCGCPHKLTPTIGPKNLRRLADAFGMTTDEIREVLEFLTAGEYPSRKSFEMRSA